MPELSYQPLHRPAPRGRPARQRRAAAAAPLVLLILLVTACQGSLGPESSTSATPQSGVKGVVVVYPTCPVEGLPADDGQSCEPVPTRAAVQAYGASGSVVATERSGHDGRFQLALRPGAYVLRATAGPGTTCHPIDVTVSPGTFTDVTVHCDTGIR
ncbi:carboxypeptidase-like regulatory domain-containing protein [Streptomyces sp. HUAS ZL42]|uniref:carboxypeptidase-like regulatory domain-containing protein n=1 Tax=Streptomyces sp. HUAS ZL42 TaxID=3231715 RepID=UPI00345F143A